MRHKLITLFSSLILGLVATLTLSTPADARVVYNEQVGLLEGYYWPGAVDYDGTKQPAHDGYCIWVERKALSTGEWTTGGIQNYQDCSASDGASWWRIESDFYVGQTTAIQIRRVSTISRKVLCTSENDCKSMRQ